jgi:putative flavoprotein involved in K+ transport
MPLDLTNSVDDWVAAFQQALLDGDVGAVGDLFADDCYWRDLVAFTWNIATMQGRDEIAAMLNEVLSTVRPSNWRVDPRPSAALIDGVTEAWLRFETSTGRGSAHVRLRDGRAWTVLTALDELIGFEEPMDGRRPMGAEHGLRPGRISWRDQRERERRELGRERQPYVLIIGGGQGGIALGARLRQLDVPTIIIDKHARVGDQWRKRYSSLCLHDPVWYDHLPYLPFPRMWPVYSPKDRLADWLEFYVRVMDLDYWCSTEAETAYYDEQREHWVVQVRREGATVNLYPTHLVLATGMSGLPNVPDVPGRERFRGEQHHSSGHPGPEPYRDKRCVVIGSNNSAFDICGALWEKGADVTMVQRSPTSVIRSESLMESKYAETYSEKALAAGIDANQSDMTLASVPYGIMPDLEIRRTERIRERDRDYYAQLEKAGFDLDFGADGSGLSMKYLRRGSGYYIDVGATELIVSGEIKIAKGQVDHLTEDAVVLADGTELPADLVVYATGYGSMNGWAAALISQEVADRVGMVWGLGSGTQRDPGPWEGELRNMWKPTQQPGLWFQGGNLAQARHYSLYLALQLKARYEGLATPVYRLAEVHHRR